MSACPMPMPTGPIASRLPGSGGHRWLAPGSILVLSAALFSQAMGAEPARSEARANLREVQAWQDATLAPASRPQTDAWPTLDRSEAPPLRAMPPASPAKEAPGPSNRNWLLEALRPETPRGSRSTAEASTERRAGEPGAAGERAVRAGLPADESRAMSRLAQDPFLASWERYLQAWMSPRDYTLFRDWQGREAVPAREVGVPTPPGVPPAGEAPSGFFESLPPLMGRGPRENPYLQAGAALPAVPFPPAPAPAPAAAVPVPSSTSALPAAPPVVEPERYEPPPREDRYFPQLNRF